MARPVDIAHQETLAFLRRCVETAKGTRLLEIGCGDGALAVLIGEQGFEVRGIDVSEEAVAEARERGVDAVHTDLVSFADEPFDTVLFSRSLHHIDSPEAAIESARTLLKPGGVVLVDDFGVDLIDVQGAYWRYAVELFLNAVGLLKEPVDVPALPPDPLTRWREDHGDHGNHQIADSHTLGQVIHQGFSVQTEEQCAYLYRYLIPELENTQRGVDMATHVLEWEKGLIEAGMTPVGLRWSARK